MKVERFGGLNTLIDAASLPSWASPDNRDVAFTPNSVGSRPGLTSLYAAIAGNPKINGLSSLTLPDTSVLPVLFTSAGELYKDVSGTLSLVSARPLTNSRMNTARAFGRLYIAFSDGKHGTHPPMSWDGTNFDRIAPDGPGQNPNLVENVAAGNISAGVHKSVVLFETRSGFLIPSLDVPTSFTAAGSRTVDVGTVNPIAIGPSWVVRRIVAFTAAGGNSYYYIPNSAMVIDNNTTTSLTAVDFTDAALLAGVNVDSMLRLTELPYMAGVVFYASRLFWWGGRRAEPSALHSVASAVTNQSFDGGFVSGLPMAWGLVAGTPVEESSVVIAGKSLEMLSDGVNGNPEIRQSYTGLFLDNTKTWRVKAWVAKTAGMTAGRLNIKSTAGTSLGIQATAAQVTTTFQEFDAEFVGPTATGGGQIRIFLDTNPINGQSFFVEDIRFYEAGHPYEDSVVRASKAESPDDYDGVDGFLNVAEENGQAVRCCFVLRDFLYLVKERSMYVTSDDGVNEPALWSIREVSDHVGTLSVRGVALGEDWAVIADRDGPYLFTGGPPAAIGPEIQPLWDGINWAYGHLIEVTVDSAKKRILFAVPYGAATEPDRMFCLDYKEGFGDPMGQNGYGRKWTTWHIAANSMGVGQRSDGFQLFLIGNGAGNGLVYKLDDAVHSDNGVAINSYWQSGYFQDSTRLQFGYLTADIAGLGSTSLSLFRGGQSDFRTVRGWSLIENVVRSMERMIHSERERMAVKVGTNFPGHWFELSGLTMWAKPALWSMFRGRNR